MGTISGWPSVASKFNTVRIRTTAGYEDADKVPESFKTAVTVHVSYLYGMTNESSMRETVKDLLWQERIVI